jgi:outer membrane protein
MKKLMYSLMVMLLFATGLHAQAVVQDDLKTLINASLSYFPKLKELNEQAEAGRWKVELGQSNYLPSVNGNVSYNYIDPVAKTMLPIPGMNKEIQFQPNQNINANISVNQVLWDFGRVKNQVDKAKDELQISKANIEWNKALLAQQVGSIYFNIIYLQQAIAVQDSLLNFLKQNERVIESKMKNGDALELDLLTVKSSTDQAMNRRVDLENLLGKQYNLLNYTTGQDAASVSAGAPLVFVWPVPAKDSLINTALNQNEEIRMGKWKLEQASHELSLNKSNAYPSLNFTGLAGYKNGYQPNLDDVRFNYLLGVGLVIPIYSGSKYSTQIRIARSIGEQARFALENNMNTVKRDVESSYLDIKSNEERLKNVQGQVAQAERACRLAQSRYQNGTVIYVELLNAQNALLQARLSKLQYQYQLCLAQLDLARLTGIHYW